MGLRVHVVRQDLANGVEVMPGKPGVCSLGFRDFGGIWDTATSRFVGESENPRIWYASTDQAPLVFHDDHLPPNLLAFGAMGGGKTRGVLAPWMVVRQLEYAALGYQLETGGTAPTGERLTMLVEALCMLMPRSWYRYKVKEHLFELRTGGRIRLVTTAQRSAALGNPIQGWNWGGGCGSDEIQDSISANDDIDARGRDAPGGVYKRCASATSKDDPGWRSFLDKLQQTGRWHVAHLEGPRNPFVHQSYWDDLRAKYDDRTYQRLVLAKDVPPEDAVYYAFDRKANLQPRPVLGARDVTAQVLGGFHALLGHDPGSYRDVTVMLKCYEVGRERIRQWYVVDEWTTQGTTEDHALHVLGSLQDRWNLQHPGSDEPKVLVRCDPQGDGDNRTDKTIYTYWKLHGFRIMSAAYNKQGQPKGRVPKEAGIQMLNGLFKNASGERRLFIACDEHGKPAAPDLYRALQQFRRDAAWRAEGDKRHKKNDLTDWPMALTYALWPYERIRDGQGITVAGALI